MATSEGRHRQQRSDSMVIINVSLPRRVVVQIEALAAERGLSRAAIVAQLCRSGLALENGASEA